MLQIILCFFKGVKIFALLFSRVFVFIIILIISVGFRRPPPMGIWKFLKRLLFCLGKWDPMEIAVLAGKVGSFFETAKGHKLTEAGVSAVLGRVVCT